MKSTPDKERFARYQSVVNGLLAKESFKKPDIHKALKEEQKSPFTVFDCFNGTLLEYFRKITGITAEVPLKATKTIREIVQAIADNEDRDYLPIFARGGVSWGKLNKVFDGELEEIIHEINLAIAA